MAGKLARGEIRLCHFAPPDKVRPVVIITRAASLTYMSRVTVAPITSTIRGVASEVILDESDGMKSACAANLHNVSTVPVNTLGKRIGQLNGLRMKQLCAALNHALGCDHDSD